MGILSISQGTQTGDFSFVFGGKTERKSQIGGAKEGRPAMLTRAESHATKMEKLSCRAMRSE